MTCPYCEDHLTGIAVSAYKVTIDNTEVEVIAYRCHKCRKVISVGPNPVRLRSQIVDDIIHELKKGSK